MGNKSENILCVSYTTWEGAYTKSVVQLMSLLARRHKVLFVEYPFTIKDCIYGFMGKGDAPAKRMLGLEDRLQTKKTVFGTTVYNWVAPPVIPTNFIKNEKVFRLLNQFNVWVYRTSVKKALRKLKMNNPINVNAYNCYFGIPMIGKMNEKANVYYCYDGMSVVRHGSRALVMDAEFTRMVDRVIVTSDYLKLDKLRNNANVDTVKNGVDFELFNKEAKSKPFSERKRKKIGYIGSVDQRFYISFVEYAVQNMPDVDFEFVGDVRNQSVKDILTTYPNVTFLPPVAPHEVPAMLSNCDAGIIPYINNEINKNVYPLKINEYLAVGVPVVLSNFAVLQEFDGFVSFTSTKEEFLSALRAEIENDTPQKIAQRIDFARENSWEKRAELFEESIMKVIDK